MYRKAFMISGIAFIATAAIGQSAPTIPDDFYNQALKYMIQHPPRVSGSDAKAAADNKRLEEENRHLYESMSRLELTMNYLALKCAEKHPMRDAVCDGRAMRILHKTQQRRRAFTGS